MIMVQLIGELCKLDGIDILMLCVGAWLTWYSASQQGGGGQLGGVGVPAALSWWDAIELWGHFGSAKALLLFLSSWCCSSW